MPPACWVDRHVHKWAALAGIYRVSRVRASWHLTEVQVRGRGWCAKSRGRGDRRPCSSFCPSQARYSLQSPNGKACASPKYHSMRMQLRTCNYYCLLPCVPTNYSAARTLKGRKAYAHHRSHQQSTRQSGTTTRFRESGLTRQPRGSSAVHFLCTLSASNNQASNRARPPRATTPHIGPEPATTQVRSHAFGTRPSRTCKG